MSAAVSREARILATVAELRALGVPLRAVVAPVLASVDASRCGDCGRVMATDADWQDVAEGERDDLCWGVGANCELDYEEPAA